jgi:hypothetical protein
MSEFMRVNGFPIEVSSEASQERLVEVGSRKRGFGGRPMIERRNTLRVWTGQTIPLAERIALAQRAAIRGIGEVFPYNTDFWSRGGLPQVTGTNGSLRIGIGSTGQPVIDENGAAESKYGTGSLAIEQGTVNIISANSRDAEAAPVGYQTVGIAGIAGSTVYAVQGLRSLQVTTSFVLAGCETTPVAGILGSTPYSASVYVYASTSKAVVLQIYDPTNGVIASKIATLIADKWMLITASGTSYPASTQARIRVLNNAPGAIVFYCDAFQLEQKTAPTTWVDGSRVSGNLQYNPAVLSGETPKPVSLSVFAWVRSPTANQASFATIFSAETDAGLGSDRVLLTRGASANNLVLSLFDSSGASDSLVYSTPFWDDDWHHVGFTFQRKDVNNDSVTELYIDGVLVASKIMTTIADLARLTKVYVGNLAGGNQWYGLIDDMVIYPYTAASDQVSGLYGMGVAMSPLPTVYVDGDIMPDPPLSVLALGSAEQATYIGATIDSDDGFQESNRTIGYEMAEDDDC